MQIIEQAEVYDAIIVGSGAGGGMAANILSENGLRVAVVEAGPFFDPKDPKTMTQMKNPWESPRRGASTNRAFGDFDMSWGCLLYTSPSPRDKRQSRMPSSA